MMRARGNARSVTGVRQDASRCRSGQLAEPSESELRRLFGELRRCKREIVGAVDGRLRDDCGLALAEFQLLDAIARLGPRAANELSRDLAVSEADVDALTDRARSDGLCFYEAPDRSRRGRCVSLTLRGVHLVAAANRVLEDELTRRIAAPLAPAAVSRMHDDLQRLRAATHPAPVGTARAERSSRATSAS
jgi:DNA-binding MarR family transcriptional regulator